MTAKEIIELIPQHLFKFLSIETRVDYQVKKLLQSGRNYNAGAYRYGFNGKEKDDELKGNGNSYDYGFRIYDTRLGRWMSEDPIAKKYPELSPYNYVANNPIFFIDLDGRIIVIPNTENRQAILKLINSRAAGVFGINDKGELYLKQKQGAKGYSKYYRDKLILAIKSDRTISIDIKQEVRPHHVAEDGVSIEESKPEEKKPSFNVDKAFGGGVTFGFIGTDQKVYISGNEDPNAKDTEGNKLTDGPEEILMHELISHAIPGILNEETENAIDNENKGRAEFPEGKNQQRKANPKHIGSRKSPNSKKKSETK